MSAVSGNEEAVIGLLVLIVLLLTRRAYGMVRGAPVSPPRLFGLMAFYLLIWGATLAVGATSTPWYVYAIDGAVFLVSAVVATEHIRSTVVLERRPPEGQVYYRLAVWIPVLYIGLFVARFAIALLLLGPSSLEFGGTPAASPGGLDLLILRTVDALFSLSAGIMVGRSVGVYLAYRRLLDTGAGRSGTPPTGASLP